MIQADLLNPAHDFRSPVFLDSEDLVDLLTLKEHVQNSHNLMLLLTNNVLLRPWCLVEIVTALGNDVQSGKLKRVDMRVRACVSVCCV